MCVSLSLSVSLSVSVSVCVCVCVCVCLSLSSLKWITFNGSVTHRTLSAGLRCHGEVASAFLGQDVRAT